MGSSIFDNYCKLRLIWYIVKLLLIVVALFNLYIWNMLVIWVRGDL